MRISPHKIKCLIFVTLIGYLGILAATQTAYGGRFMNLRWMALCILFLVGGCYWLSVRQQKKSGFSLDEISGILLLYLLMTSLSVVFAESPLFSGFRWASHAMMLIVFLIFLRQIITFLQIQKLLLLLQVIIGVLLLLCLLKPAPQTIYDNLQVFRGAMGNANTMGQIAAIGVLIYLHGFLTERTKMNRYLMVFLACGAMLGVWLSGSRSATTMLISGIGLITFFYRYRIRRKLFVTTFIIVLLAFVFPELPYRAKHFIYKSSDPSAKLIGQITKSRSEIWGAAWEGFKSRPLTGWGFGADNSISKDWTIRATAVGTVERDAVNDLLFMLEGCGVIGVGAYLLLIYVIWKHKPTHKQILRLQRVNHQGSYMGEYYFSISRLHAMMFTLAISSLVLVQFDNTALSAGNFVSAVIWLSVASAGALRREVLLIEFGMYPHLIAENEKIRQDASIFSSPRW